MSYGSALSLFLVARRIYIIRIVCFYIWPLFCPVCSRSVVLLHCWTASLVWNWTTSGVIGTFQLGITISFVCSVCSKLASTVRFHIPTIPVIMALCHNSGSKDKTVLHRTQLGPFCCVVSFLGLKFSSVTLGTNLHDALWLTQLIYMFGLNQHKQF